MIIIKEPDFISKYKKLLVFNNALSSKLIDDCNEYAKMCMDNNICTTTNIESWEYDIKGNSKEIKVVTLNETNKTLFENICRELKYNYNLETKGLILNIHIMTEGCYINEH